MSSSSTIPPRVKNSADRWRLRLALVVAAAYIIWHMTGLVRRDRVSRFFDLGSLEILCIATVWTLIDASRRPDLPKRLCTALRWLAAGLSVQALAGADLIIERVLLTGRDPWLDYTAIFALAYAITIVGLMVLPRAGQRSQRGNVRALLDGAAFVAGAGLPLWLFALQPLLAQSHGASEIRNVLSMPVISFLGLLTASWAIETRWVLPDRTAFGMLICGIGLFWLGDMVYSIDRANAIIPGGTLNWINASNAVAFCLCLIGAQRMIEIPLLTGRPRVLLEFSPLPLVTMVVELGFVLILIAFGRPDTGQLVRLLIGLAIFLLVLLARESFVIRDSLKLAAVQAREEGQARFEAMVRHSSDVIMVVDGLRLIRFSSPASQSVLGIAPEQLAGRELLSLVHPEDRAQGAVFLDELILKPQTIRTIRWRMAAEGDGYRDLETAGSNRLQENAIAGLVLNSRDVTERTSLEEQLQRARRMEAVGRLAGGVAHDFNNLLTIILTNSDVALMLMPQGATGREAVQEIRRAAQRGAAVTGRLLAFSRTESLRLQAVSPAKVLAEALPLLERTLAGQGRLVTQLPSADRAVKMDPDEFVHVLINLAANARDAMTEAGTLTISIWPATIREPLIGSYLDAPAGDYLVVEVTDDGRGMDETTRGRAFEPFFTTKSRSQGTGLGLAAVYGFVKAAEGGLTLRTAAGQGTTVQMWLPEVPLAAEVPTPVVAPRAARGSLETILLVDDEPALRNASQRILISEGYAVLVAADGGDAIRRVEDHGGTIDLAVIDVVMPGKSGPQVAAELARMQPGLRVLFISGFTDNQFAAKQMIPPGAQLLAKPFTGEQLTARVRAALAGAS